MEALLSSILKDICIEYGLEESIITPIIEKLNKEFYFKIKDMKNLSFELWQSFNLPANLYYILNDKYKLVNTGQQQQVQIPQMQIEKIDNPQPQITQQQIPQIQPHNQQHPSSLSKPIEQPKKKERDLLCQSQVINSDSKNAMEKMSSQPVSVLASNPKSTISPEDLQTYLTILDVEIGNNNILKDIMSLITSLLSKIVSHPSEDKYKKLNIKKVTDKYLYQSIPNLLSILLFKKVDSQFIAFTGQIKDLIFALAEISVFLKSKDITLEGSNTIEQQQLKIDFDQLYNREMQRRNDLIQKHSVARNPKLLRLNSLYSINNAIKEMNQEKIIEYQSEENTILKDKALSLINSNSIDRFSAKSRSMYETLIKTSIILQSHIRLLFPDEVIIEVDFCIKETIGDIHTFIKQCLANPQDEFVLSTTPPPKKYIKLNQTIQELKLYPKVMLNVNFSCQYNKLKEELFNQSIEIQQSINSNFSFNPNAIYEK